MDGYYVASTYTMENGSIHTGLALFTLGCTTLVAFWVLDGSYDVHEAVAAIPKARQVVFPDLPKPTFRHVAI